MKVSPLLHPLESLGLVRSTRGDIRVEKLSLRLKPSVPFPHRHDFYQLIWIEKGHGWHEIDFALHRLIPFQFYIMKPGQVHGWNFSPQTEGIVIEFSSESLPTSTLGISAEETLLQLPSLVTFKAAAAKNFQHLCKSMLGEFSDRRWAFEKVLESQLNVLIIELARQAPSTTHSRSEVTALDAILPQFRKLVEEHFRQEHELEFYSDHLGLSPRALTMRTTRQLGKSGRQVIFDRLLLEAKRMLAYSSLPVSGIGYDLGFEDANHFSRFFKTQAGQAAQAFRQLHEKS